MLILPSPTKRPMTLARMRDAGATVISLFRNPYDLRPAIDAIAERLTALHPANSKIHHTVALMGEEHTIPSHVMLGAGVTKKLYSLRPNDLAVGMELPVNLPRQILSESHHSEEEIGILLGRDDDGYVSLRLAIEKLAQTYTPVSHAQFQMMCLGNRISTCFADCAHADVSGDYIDTRHIMTRAITNLFATVADINAPLESTSSVGVAIRNVHMRNHMQGHARYSGKHLNVMACGAAHVVGLTDKYHTGFSLSQLFADAGAQFVPVLPIGQVITPEHIPEEALPFMQHAIIVTNMVEDRRYMRRDIVKELDHVEHLMVQSGMR